MTKGLETGRDKIQRICDALKEETIEPARQEAREIVENGKIQAAELVAQAKEKAQRILQEANQEIEEKKRVFHSSFQLACRQGIEKLKQVIEKELFNEELKREIHREMAEPKWIAKLLGSFLGVLEEKGIEEDVAILIPKTLSARSISSLLTERILHRLKEQKFQPTEMEGGVQIQLKESQITIDISEEAVRALIEQYIRKDLRDLVFRS